jgi:hypothetical protein
VVIACSVAAVFLASAPGGAVAAGKAQRPLPAAPLVPRDLSALAEHPFALVQLEQAAPPSSETLLRLAHGLRISSALRVWRLPSAAARRLAPRLAVSGALREIQPAFPLALAGLGHTGANDPSLADEWWLAAIGADRVEPPGPGVPVTVIDSGLDLEHPDFSGRPETTALNNQRVVFVEDSHGTMVSSVLAAPANGVGIVGVYPQARLYVWDARRLDVGDVISGLDAAARLGRGVVNLSFGSESLSRTVNEAVLHAVNRGLVLVAAGGNERARGNPDLFPAALPHVLTVAATDQAGAVAAFSSQSRWIDVAAPGVAMPVAVPLTFAASGVGAEDGTSFSAPLVSGAAAWVWTARPTLDRSQLFEVMRRSARDIGTPGRDPDSGLGLLDIPAALGYEPPVPDPQEPNDDVSHVAPGGVFRLGRAPLTSRSRAAGTVTARLDVSEDPEDVYRVWIPPGRRVVAAVTGDRDVDLQLWGPATDSVLEERRSRPEDLLRESARRGSGRETVAFLSRTQRGLWAYVDVYLRDDVAFGDASYTLDVRIETAPR